METPSQRISPPGGYYYECDGPVLGSDTTMTDDNLLRDVRDLTQRLNFNASQNDHTSPIIQSTSPELAEILSRLRQLTNSDLQGGQLLHGGPQSQRTTATAAVVSWRQLPAPGGRRRRRGACRRNRRNWKSGARGATTGR